jgi:hypothetical protein
MSETLESVANDAADTRKLAEQLLAKAKNKGEPSRIRDRLRCQTSAGRRGRF